MNKYVAQLLEVIQKKTGCDTSGAVRWLANQAGCRKERHGTGNSRRN